MDDPPPVLAVLGVLNGVDHLECCPVLTTINQQGDNLQFFRVGALNQLDARHGLRIVRIAENFSSFFPGRVVLKIGFQGITPGSHIVIKKVRGGS